VIRLVYRSKKESQTDTELNDQEKAIATNAYRLLDDWKTPLGMKKDGSFSEEDFSSWLELTKSLCNESGHFEVALTHIGGVLVYSPPDLDGLWINEVVADALYSKDADKMRRGFTLKLLNSRGGHWVDPTGQPVRDLAVKYRLQAEDVENAVTSASRLL
jgi:hypothetical protein